MNFDQVLVELSYAQAHFLAHDTEATRENFRKKLEVATANHLNQKETAGARELVLHWLAYLGPVLAQDYRNISVRYQIDKFVQLVLKRHMVAFAAKESGYATTLALVCMAGVELKQMGYTYDLKYNVGNILRRWFDTDQADAAVQSLEACVKLLYSDRAWFLYHDDVDHARKLPGHLWLEQVPLHHQYVDVRQELRNLAIAMPTNLAV